MGDQLKKIVVTGGAGFLGQQLVAELQTRDYQPHVVDMRKPTMDVPFTIVDLMKPIASSVFADADAVIHLAGASISRRWTMGAKRLIYDSRIVTTRNIVVALQRASKRPEAFITASAVGFYGDRGDELLTEEAGPGTDFLAQVCQDWEEAASAARAQGIRVAHLRTAPVLGSGGLLGTLLPFFRLGLGGRLASGRQWFPWIHADDIVALYIHAIEQPLEGPINAAAPQQIRNSDFTKVLGSALHRPTVVPVPTTLLRLRFGGLADAIVASQKVSSQLVSSTGFSFAHPTIKEALDSALRTSA